MSCACLNCAEMVPGQAYTFFFKYGGWLGVNVPPASVAATVAKDSNFLNPSAAQVNCGIICAKQSVMAVSFTYNGKGSLVGQAGQEMQNILANFWLVGFGTSLIFDGAVMGVASPCCDPNSPGSSSLWLVAAGVILVIGVLIYLKGPSVVLAPARSAIA